MNGERFENLTIGYGLASKHEKVVASGLSATLESGKLTCLLGPNGSGKTTLMRTLARMWKDKVAIVLTRQPSLRNLSVEEVVALGRTPFTNFWGTLRAQDRKVVGESMQQVGIDGLASRPIQTLSDGERQKVMIAKALAQQTPVMLLDEPTAFLDYPSRQGVMLLLRTLAHEQNKAILLSTHDVELAAQLTDETWFLGGGELLTGLQGLSEIHSAFRRFEVLPTDEMGHFGATVNN